MKNDINLLINFKTTYNHFPSVRFLFFLKYP